MTINRILRSLVPESVEELAILRFLIHCAQLIQKGGQTDLTMSRVEAVAYRDPQIPQIEIDMQDFISSLSEASKKYFYGLIEAVDIYQSIKGQPLRSDSLVEGDPAVYELRQIRDMCMDEGPRSIY